MLHDSLIPMTKTNGNIIAILKKPIYSCDEIERLPLLIQEWDNLALGYVKIGFFDKHHEITEINVILNALNDMIFRGTISLSAEYFNNRLKVGNLKDNVIYLLVKEETGTLDVMLKENLQKDEHGNILATFSFVPYDSETDKNTITLLSNRINTMGTIEIEQFTYS